MYKNLDLEDFEWQFSAYQRHDGSDDNITERMSTLSRTARELSVIDGRRAQNCTILLSKLKMTNNELLQAVLSVDSQEEIPKDMCEQVCAVICVMQRCVFFNHSRTAAARTTKVDFRETPV